MNHEQNGITKMMDQNRSNGSPKLDNLNLEGVMEQYQSALLRYATRILNNEDAAQDVVQEAFIRLHGNMEKISDRGVQLKGWLFRTTHNAAVDYIRKESRRRCLHQKQSNEVEPYASDNDAQRNASERHTLVMQHLNVLKPKEREVLVLRLQEEMTYKEIAAVLKRSEGYVGTLIHTATKKLSQSLRQAGVVS
jgi:RNA polymerase sigma factor (sigma-70 family)